jgi:hypothetical protein
MTISRRSLSIAIGALGAGAAYPAHAEGLLEGLANDAQGLMDDVGDYRAASDAYVYGYPLVTMEMTRRVMTNIAAPEGTHAPMGQFMRARAYPDASFRDVTAPNADTLYTVVWLDVGKEPWILSLPDMKDRYFLFPMLDGWTDVFQDPGTRTTGTGAQTYAITGPGWTGTLPAGVVEYKSATAMVWVLGRIYCSGAPEDYAAVHALQDQCKVYPLSAWGKEWTPPAGKADPSIDMKTAVRDQVNAMSGVDYFRLLADLLKTNPPAPEDAPILPKLAQIGIVPGKDFDPSAADPAVLNRVPKLSYNRIMLSLVSGGDFNRVNGWAYSAKLGSYGVNYLQRALVAALGLGANLSADAVYPMSKRSGAGLIPRKYDGANKYVMRFAKGQTPPVKGFWSLTMYDENMFFVANPLNRYSISPRQNLKENPDGSIDLLIQHDSPGADRESNWLPAPKGEFVLMLRMYWPDPKSPTILDGTWTIPAVAIAS